MARLNLALLALVVACAIGVITAQHQSRKLFHDLEGEQAAAQKLDTEWTQLQIEQGTWGVHKRVESVAAKALGMRAPDAASTVVISIEERAP
jgi:cell division protein FtsL